MVDVTGNPIPPHLLTMREITGILETPGSEDNPTILDWADEIGKRFPEMRSYAALYTHDSIPWCGLTVAYVMAHNGIRPVFGDTDTDKFLWARAWEEFGTEVDTPQLGDVLVFSGHVSLFDGQSGDYYLCRGGNQSDMVNVSKYRASSVLAIRRPPGVTASILPVRPPVTTGVTKVSDNAYSDMLEHSQVKPEWQNAIDRAANLIVSNKEKYKIVEDAIGVPWAFVGVLHMRESDNDFNTHLHNGDPINSKTTHVPSGRPEDWPPDAPKNQWWSLSAIDALTGEGFANKKDWTLEAICDRGERYNGLGYKRMGMPSPYLWSGTSTYTKGKYVADGEFDPNTIDKQLGIIPVYKRILTLAPEADIRNNSQKIQLISKVRTGIKVGITTVGGLFSMSTLDVFKQWFTAASGVVDGKMIISLAIAGVMVWVLINVIENMIMNDAKVGRYIPSGFQATSPPPLDDAPKEPTLKTEPEPANVEPVVESITTSI